MLSQRPLISKPAGSENFDREALSEQQQITTNKTKIDTRIQNELYLRNHPEVSLLIKDFLKESFLNKPNDIREFAAEYFTDPQLKERIGQLVKENESSKSFNKVIQNTKTQAHMSNN